MIKLKALILTLVFSLSLFASGDIESSKEQMRELGSMLREAKGQGIKHPRFKKIEMRLRRVRRQLSQKKPLNPKQRRWLEQATAWTESAVTHKQGEQHQHKGAKPEMRTMQLKRRLMAEVAKQERFARQNGRLVGRENVKKHLSKLKKIRMGLKRAQSPQAIMKFKGKFMTFQKRFNQFAKRSRSKRGGRGIASENGEKPDFGQLKSRLLQDMKQQFEFAKKNGKQVGEANLKQHLTRLEKIKAKVKIAKTHKHLMRTRKAFESIQKRFHSFLERKNQKEVHAAHEKGPGKDQDDMGQMKVTEIKKEFARRLKMQFQYAKKNAKVVGAGNYRKHIGNLKKVRAGLSKANNIRALRALRRKFSGYQRRFNGFLAKRKEARRGRFAKHGRGRHHEKKQHGAQGDHHDKKGPEFGQHKDKLLRSIEKQMKFALSQKKVVGQRNLKKHLSNLKRVKALGSKAATPKQLKALYQRFEGYRNAFNRHVGKTKSPVRPRKTKRETASEKK
jgi:hypothetical protein